MRGKGGAPPQIVQSEGSSTDVSSDGNETVLEDVISDDEQVVVVDLEGDEKEFMEDMVEQEITELAVLGSNVVDTDPVDRDGDSDFEHSSEHIDDMEHNLSDAVEDPVNGSEVNMNILMQLRIQLILM